MPLDEFVAGLDALRPNWVKLSTVPVTKEKTPPTLTPNPRRGPGLDALLGYYAHLKEQYFMIDDEDAGAEIENNLRVLESVFESWPQVRSFDPENILQAS